MINLKKVGKTVIFPNRVFIIVLFPLAMGFLLFSMLYFGSEHIVSYISYALAFYSLLVACLKIKDIVNYIKKIKNENKYLLRYKQDINLRINISLYGSLIINIVYSIFQLCLGLYNKSFWFISMSIYYVLLSLVRFYLVKYTKKNKPGENLLIEYKRYNFCGWIMLSMNLAVTTIIYFIIYFDRTFYHNQITAISLAAYTFTAFGLSIYNFIKYRRFKNPVYSAAKSLNLVAGCVSMITLTTTMLTTFGNEEIIEFKKILLTIVGTFVSLFIIMISIQIIIVSYKKIKELKSTI